MNRRSFLKWLGIGVPAVAVAALAALKVEAAVLGEWDNYYNESSVDIARAIEAFEKYGTRGVYFDKDFVANLKAEGTVFEALASRHSIPVNAGVKREFFRYES